MQFGFFFIMCLFLVVFKRLDCACVLQLLSGQKRASDPHGNAVFRDCQPPSVGAVK